MASTESRFWSPLVSTLSPYVPGEQRQGVGVVKLNTNENPYPPSPEVLATIKQIDGHALRRYPDPEATKFCSALATYHDLQPQQVFVGNGSDEVLALAFKAFFAGNGQLCYPAISYSFYPVYCDLLSIDAHTIELTDDFSLSLERFPSAAGGIVFPNPNAPTSRAVSLDDIRTLLERFDSGVVLIDEAYADLGAESAIALIDEFPNLIVTRTYSKTRSLAGMRIGMAFGNEALIEGLRRVKNSFNSYPLDVVAQAAGIASLADQAYYQSVLDRIVATRTRTTVALQELGFDVLPSASNFLFARPPNGNAAQLFDHLNRADILVRYWSAPAIAEWLRISIGTDDDMSAFLSALASAG